MPRYSQQAIYYKISTDMKIITNVFIKSLLLCTFFLLINANAQQLSKEQIKVAYIYNFLKHINWPAEEKKTQFVIGVYQDKSFHALLQKAFANKKVKNKDISILLITNIPQAMASDLFYIPQQFNEQLAQIANKVRGSQTLLVTDNSADKHNAMLNLITSNGANAISFEVNKSNIVYEQLTTSAQLLLLGGTELDIASLYRETEQAMQVTRERELALNAELAAQQSKLAQTNAKLSKLNQDLQRSSKEVKQQQLAMKELLKNEQKKEQELAKILQQLSEANQNYSVQTKAISDKKQEIAIKEQEKLQMANLIDQNKLILKQQQQNIASQKSELNKQHGELAVQKQTIVSQKETITITSLFVIVIAFAFVLVVGLFLKNKKTNFKLTEALSNLEETQSQLIQSEKMASLGKLIAGVAHEINTPLGIAVTSTSLIQENTENIAKKLTNKSLNQRQLQSYINIVTESAVISNKGLERVIELMHNFKEVAADQIVEKRREINVAHYVNEVMTTLSNEMKKNHVNYIFNGDDTIRISTIPGALAQVITNLVNNSIRHGFQSDSDGREKNNNIEISLEQNSIDEVCLTYQDNGIGMSKDVLLQVFDPFFTTKRNQGGTGLGMNIVFNIIEQKLCGHIDISSNIDEGVICKITLPLLVSAD
jgi:signal transduction histidine kinase